MSAMSDDTVNEDNERLKAIVEYVEIRDQIKYQANREVADIYKEAKTQGFDVKAIKQVVEARRKSPEELQETEKQRAVYFKALGLDPSTMRNRSVRGASEPNKLPEDVISWESTGGLGE